MQSIIHQIKSALYQLKEWTRSLFIYPEFHFHDQNYDQYWHQRNLGAKTSLNEFQEKRAHLTLSYVKSGKTFMDLGSGSGAVLLYIHKKTPMQKLIGVDVSDYALSLAQGRGIETIKADLSNLDTLQDLPPADYISLFEIIEHLANSETLLRWAVLRAKEGVFFSIPNTGFFTHRLRLLFGRFPLQWRQNPSEHLRFWTVRDIKWLMAQLGYKEYKLHLYQGIPLLRRFWPSLFAEGIFVYIPK